MKESKICYFKELKSNINVLLSSIIGILCGLFIFVVDEFNLPNQFLDKFDVTARYNTMTITLLYGALVGCIALLVLSLFIKSFSKKLIKEDSFLISYDFFALTLFVVALIKLNNLVSFKLIFVIIITILAFILTIIRLICVRESISEIELASVNYRRAIVKRTNVSVVFSLAMLIGIFLGILIYYVDFDAILGNIVPWWLEQTKFTKFGYVAGLYGSAFVMFNLHTIISNKRIKFNWVDICLIFATIVSFFSGLYFSFDLNKPEWHLYSWSAIVLSLFITIIIRCIFIDAKDVETKNYGKSSYYFIKLADKCSLISILFFGFVIGGLLINIDVIGLKSLFSSTSNAVCTVVLILMLITIFSFGILSITKNGIKRDKALVFDYILLLSLVIGGVMLFDLYYSPTIIKLIIWVIAFLVTLVLISLRIHLIEREEVEEIAEEDELLIDETETSVVEDSLSYVEDRLIENSNRRNIKHYYINKLKFTNSKTKSFYSEIKNFLLSYGTNSTITRKNETFRKSGIVCKLSVSGKTLRVHLPLDPNDEVAYNSNKYHQFSLASKKRYAEVPFTMKIKSPTACKRVLELIEKVCLNKNLKLNNFYSEYDYSKDLDIDGRAIFDKACCLDMLVDKCDISYSDKFNGDETPSLEKICSYIPTLEESIDKLNHTNGKEAVVTLDKVVDMFNDETICLESLKKYSLIDSDVERLVIHIADSLNKPVSVICDEIDEHSALVVLATGGKIAYYHNGSQVIEDLDVDDIEDDEDDDDSDDIEDYNEEEVVRVKSKRTTFINKIKFTSDKTKEYYSSVKNKLLSYGIKSRLTRKNEQFRKSGLVAKISISGKTLRLHLPLDPNDLEKYPLTKYHQINLSDKKQYSKVPFTIKIKSDRALKRALQLIDELCNSLDFRLKRKYENIDFTKELVIDGSAIFEKLNCVDKLVDNFDDNYLNKFKEENAEAYEKLFSLLPSISRETSSDGEIQNVYIDTVLDKIEGNEISLDTLKDSNVITKSTNRICVKIHNTLDKKITVVCDEITPDACLAVLSTGGKVILIK